ncbi:MAG: cysteine rich repeat-containing protein [Pseudomonadota bacterium]|nr:cysteine rich repeat-containing protein [Pseudomonadota bacterium]
MFVRASLVLLLGVFSAGALAQSKFEMLEKEKATIEKYCRADVERLCAGVEPGGGRIKECLKKHKEEMSVGCAQALQELKKSM